MQLLDVPTSLFCARVRSVIYHKGLSLEVLAPPGGLGSAEHAAVDAVARVPALRFRPDEPWLHESLIIALRLEEAFPAPALEPAAVDLRWIGRQGLMFLDSYAVASLFDLLRLAGRPEAEAEIHRSRQRLASAYSWLEQSLPQGVFALGGEMTLLDIWLGLTVALGAEFEARTRLELAPPPRVAALAHHALSQPALARVMGELNV